MLKSILKYIPRSFKEKVKIFKVNIDYWVIFFLSANKYLASFYYGVISSSFRREHFSVLKGQLEYRAQIKRSLSSRAMLRRNIHRIEKGLIMRPRRDSFAEGYIKETVLCYTELLKDPDRSNSDELKWAFDVLEKYFSVVKSEGRIDQARLLFSEEFIDKCSEPDSKYEPYSYSELPKSRISYDDLFVLFRRRRSVRWYKQIPVDDQLIASAVQAAALAPSACNRQPFRFVVANAPEEASEIAKFAMGTSGFANNLQCLIAVVGSLSNYPEERDRHVIYIDAALASMQLMLAFDTLNLATCPINWPDVEGRERLISKKLNLKDYERVIMLISVGYAEDEGGIPYSQKKSASELIQYWK